MGSFKSQRALIKHDEKMQFYDRCIWQYFESLHKELLTLEVNLVNTNECRLFGSETQAGLAHWLQVLPAARPQRAQLDAGSHLLPRGPAWPPGKPLALEAQDCLKSQNPR